MHKNHKKEVVMEKEAYSHTDKIIIFFSAMLYFAVVVFLSLSTDDFFNVLLGLSPTLIYLIINYAYLKYVEKRHLLVWLLPMPLIIVYAIVANFSISIMKNITWQTLVAVNLFLTYIFACIIVFIGTPRKEKTKVIVQKPQGIVITKETFLQNLKSIEDKCKAINFVIGRVYSNKKGGSLVLRNKINFPRDWYNAFSELTADFNPKDRPELVQVLNNFLERLKIIQKKEKEVFELNKDAMLEIKRDPKGNDAILDVLIKNDSDPVKDYYNSALAVCEAVLSYLNK
jgi:hypothetical protein